MFARRAVAVLVAAAAAAVIPASAGAGAVQPDRIHAHAPRVHVLPYSVHRDYGYLRDVYGRLEIAHAGAYHGEPVMLIGEAREICDDLASRRAIGLEFPAHTHDRRIVVRAAVRHLCPIW